MPLLLIFRKIETIIIEFKFWKKIYFLIEIINLSNLILKQIMVEFQHETCKNPFLEYRSQIERSYNQN